MKWTTIERVNRAVVSLRGRLELALVELGLPPSVAVVIERVIFWLTILSFALLTALAVYQDAAFGAEHTTIAEEVRHYAYGPEVGEGVPEFRARVCGYAATIALAADSSKAFTPRQMRAMLVSLGSFESRWRRDVCEVLDRDTAPGRPAVGCWQAEVGAPGSVYQSALLAVKHLDAARRYCEARGFDPFEGAFSLYATGGTCRWPEAIARAQRFRSVYWRMGAEIDA